MTDQDEVRDISGRFYEAVNTLLQGDAAPMLALWSQADDASYCDTRGQIVRGSLALEAYWRRAAELNADAPVRLHATGEIQQVVIGGDLAYVIAVEQVRREGESGAMTARATNVYRREVGGWRLFHRHADAPPSMADSNYTEEKRFVDTFEKQMINPDGLAPPRGFTHGILVMGGKLLFLAGQDASDAQGKIVAPGELIVQFEQALRNLAAVVEAAGGKPTDLVKLTIFVKSRDAYVAALKPLGQAYRRIFGDYYPAMALFEVSGLFQPEALVEIEGIAVLP